MNGALLVATCGNADAGDDAFGPRVGRRLRAVSLAGVEVIDLDIRPAALLDHLEGREVLVLVDAVREREAEDRLLVFDLDGEELPALRHDDALSTHGLGLSDQIALARQLDILPDRVWLVALPLRGASVDSEARASLDERVEEAVRVIADLAARTRPSV